jgi:hypothetical protein
MSRGPRGVHGRDGADGPGSYSHSPVELPRCLKLSIFWHVFISEILWRFSYDFLIFWYHFYFVSILEKSFFGMFLFGGSCHTSGACTLIVLELVPVLVL